jgi:hypothetical protein
MPTCKAVLQSIPHSLCSAAASSFSCLDNLRAATVRNTAAEQSSPRDLSTRCTEACPVLAALQVMHFRQPLFLSVHIRRSIVIEEDEDAAISSALSSPLAIASAPFAFPRKFRVCCACGSSVLPGRPSFSNKVHADHASSCIALRRRCMAS